MISEHSNSGRLVMIRLRGWGVVAIMLFEVLNLGYQGQSLGHQSPRLLGTLVRHTVPDNTSISTRFVSVPSPWEALDALHAWQNEYLDLGRIQPRKEWRWQKEERKEEHKRKRQKRKQQRKSKLPYKGPDKDFASPPLLGPAPGDESPRTVPIDPHGRPSSGPWMPSLIHPPSPPAESPWLQSKVPGPSQLPRTPHSESPSLNALPPRQWAPEDSSIPTFSPAMAPSQGPQLPGMGPAFAPRIPPHDASCGVCGTSYHGIVGETLASVSKLCKVNASFLLKANPEFSTITDGIAGRTLSVPCTGDDPIGCNQCGASYVIKGGEFLSTVAVNCSVDLSALEDANKDLLSFDYVSPGQYLTMPCKESVPSRFTEGCGYCGLFHTVAKNETIGDVVQACNVTAEELQMANPALDEPLTEGQVLNIPCFGTSSARCGLCGQAYRVQEGDDGQSIQLKCRTKGLAVVNPNVDLRQLDVGQLLNVPCAPPPACSPCSPTVAIDDTSLHSMASRCKVPIELLMYANDIFPGEENAGLNIGHNLSVPCEVLPAPTNKCSICGASFSALQEIDVANLSEACGVSLNGIYGIRDNNLTPATVSVSYATLQLPCESPAVGCGPCGVAYTAQNETLASVAVKCLVHPTTLKQLNRYLDSTTDITGRTLGLPCKDSLLGLVKSSGSVIGPTKVSVALKMAGIVYFVVELAATMFNIFWIMT